MGSIPNSAANHREAVGGGVDYDRIGALQFGVLVDQGLREEHHVLEVGCGPLRLGRILIPWLDADRYCAVDPDTKVVDQALWQEVSNQMYVTKLPQFNSSDDFRFKVFGREFDFVVVHSVFIHMSLAQIRACLGEAMQVLAPGGKVLFTFKEGETEEAEGWTYPEHLTQSWGDIAAAVADAGLQATELSYAGRNFNHRWVKATHRA
jgi:SAM-dependent methyltransferase